MPSSSVTSGPAVPAAMSSYNSELMETYAPAKQAEYMAKYHDRCFTGTAPTLRSYAEVHGTANVRVWLAVQLRDLCKFAGVKKMEPSVIDQAADTIAAQYPGLKLTEFMVFCQLFKAGHYGHMYGVFDPLVLTASLKEFAEGYRTRELARIAQEEDRQARAQYDSTAITLDEAIARGLCPNIQALLARHKTRRARA